MPTHSVGSSSTAMGLSSAGMHVRYAIEHGPGVGLDIVWTIFEAHGWGSR